MSRTADNEEIIVASGSELMTLNENGSQRFSYPNVDIRETGRRVLRKRFPNEYFYVTWKAGNGKEQAAKSKAGYNNNSTAFL